jgi:hypothetical protein
MAAYANPNHTGGINSEVILAIKEWLDDSEIKNSVKPKHK